MDTGAVKVVVYPSGQHAGSIVVARSGVSTDPTLADQLRASVRHTAILWFPQLRAHRSMWPKRATVRPVLVG
jgi:hypothetical protein